VLFFTFLFYPSFLLFSCSRSFLNSCFFYVIYVCLSLSLYLFVPFLDVRLIVFLLVLASFIKSISCVISSFLTFCLGCARLPWLNGGNGTHSATVERRFYNESLCLGKRLRLPHCIEELPFSFTRCQVLRRREGKRLMPFQRRFAFYC